MLGLFPDWPEVGKEAHWLKLQIKIIYFLIKKTGYLERSEGYIVPAMHLPILKVEFIIANLIGGIRDFECWLNHYLKL